LRERSPEERKTPYSREGRAGQHTSESAGRNSPQKRIRRKDRLERGGVEKKPLRCSKGIVRKRAKRKIKALPCSSRRGLLHKVFGRRGGIYRERKGDRSIEKREIVSSLRMGPRALGVPAGCDLAEGERGGAT